MAEKLQAGRKLRKTILLANCPFCDGRMLAERAMGTLLKILYRFCVCKVKTLSKILVYNEKSFGQAFSKACGVRGSAPCSASQ